jgi:DNA-binding CsgD family transcriptional regulator
MHNSIDGFWKNPSYNRKDLFKEYPSSVVADRFDRLWFFSQGNASCFTVKDNQLVRLRYDLTDYAKDTYPRGYENVYCLDSNFIVIGQEEGFIGYNLTSKYSRTFSTNRIRKVIIKNRNGQERNISGRVDLVNGTQYSKAREGLEHRSTLKFYYSAGSSKFSSVEYSTFLYGFDKEWSDWSNENYKEYTNLPKGDYKFIVRSVNRLNEESIPAVYEFRILSPWYLTIPAKISYLFLLLLLVFFTERLIRYRSQKIQAKIQKEQQEEASRREQIRVYEDLKKEKEIIRLRNEKLRIDNLYKSKELANSTMGAIKKNQFLTDIRSELEKVREYSEKNKLVTNDIRDIIRKIDRDIDNEENWKVFEDYFDRVHEKFLNRMKSRFPILTANDLRLSAYLRMNLSTKEIAPLMNITVRGVEISRYRLRKKLQLGREDNLYDFLLKF